MSKFMVLVASAIFVTGVVVLAQQRSEPESLPGAEGPLRGRTDPASSQTRGKIASPVADTHAADRVCKSEGDAQVLCLAELKQAARLVAN